MSKNIRKLFQRKTVAKEPSAPSPAPRPTWKAVLTFDPLNPESVNLQILDDARPQVDDVIVALGLLRDAALTQKGAAILQQQINMQATQAQVTQENSYPATAEKTDAPTS